MKVLPLSQTEYSNTRVHIDDDEMVIEQRSDPRVLQAIVDETKELRNHGTVIRMRELQPAARIPIVIHAQWKKEWRKHHADRWTWGTYLAMKINSPEFAAFRLQDKRL